MANVGNVRVNGTALRAIRTDRRITVRQLAADVGISPSYLSRLERGLRGTAWAADETVAALAAALSMPLEAIASDRSAA